MTVSRLIPHALLSLTAGAALLTLALASTAPVNADALKWGAGPPHLPAGVQIVILDGDPSKTVPITLRLKMPAGYQIPAHWHPTQEDVTVLSGSLNVGMGDVLSKTGNHPAQTRRLRGPGRPNEPLRLDRRGNGG